MYTLIYEPSNNCSESIVDLLRGIITLRVEESTSGGFTVWYKLNHCFECKSPFQYGSSFTKEEAINNFYKTNGIRIACNNGYKLFKEVR